MARNQEKRKLYCERSSPELRVWLAKELEGERQKRFVGNGATLRLRKNKMGVVGGFNLKPEVELVLQFGFGWCAREVTCLV